MKTIAPRQVNPAFHTMRPATYGRAAFVLLAVIFLSGCGVLQSALPQTQGQTDGSQATVIAAQVIAMAATAQAQNNAAQPPAVQPQQATQEPLPTYTALPTYTMAPTWTPQPTYTPYPTFTVPAAPVIIQVQPTATNYGTIAHPYILRVRNMTRGTYWIGTVMPYGGNFIKSLHYVEFYPPQPTWMRIWWCRFTSSYFRDWSNFGLNYYHRFWDDDRHRGWDNSDFWTGTVGLYGCNCKDEYVDEALIEISIP